MREVRRVRRVAAAGAVGVALGVLACPAAASAAAGLEPAAVARPAPPVSPTASTSAASGGIPSFSVGISKQAFIGPLPAGQSRPMWVKGSWNFPNSWAGQAAPVDLASLQFSMPSCVHMTNLSSLTYTYSGTSTHLGYLKSANVGRRAPIWAIRDYEKGFVAQADHGIVQTLLVNTCGRYVKVGADFTYEANQGGSVVSASAGWGILSISYGSSGLRRQEGTSPIYFGLAG